MAGHGEEHHGGGPGFYLLIALILGVITFVEFAIIQWPQAWLSTFAVVLTLIVLSVAKFLMVVAYFMHLRDDDNTYSGFFGSGMVIALGSFVVLTFLFTVPSVANALRGGGAIEVEAGAAEHAEETAEAAHGGGHGGVSAEVLASIASGGYSREPTAILDSPPPKNLALQLTPPPLSEDVSYTLEPSPPFGSAAPDRPAPDAPDDGGPGGDVEAQAPVGIDTELGLEIYNRNCVGCHQGGGRGIPGAFPPLARHLPTVLAAEGGRAYLIDALLYGVQGRITVEGQNYNGVMPGWSQIDDASIAAVLNHELTAWGNDELLEDFSPITAEEVAAERGKGLTPAAVYELRNALELP